MNLFDNDYLINKYLSSYKGRGSCCVRFCN